MVDASRPQAGLGNSKTAAFLSQQIARGDAHVLEEHLAVAFIVYIAHYWQVAHTVTPSRIFGQDYMLCWRYLSGLLGSVLPITIKILQRSRAAPEVHHLRPFNTYSSPSRLMES